MTRQRRIIFVVTSSLTATTFLRGYLRALRSSGWQVGVVAAPGPGLEDLAAAEGVALHQVAMKREPSLVSDVLALVNMTWLLLRARPDVIVYATPKASLLAAVAARIAGVRVRIYELWGLRLETATGLGARALHGLERFTMALSTSIVANSASLARRAVDLGLTGKEPVVLGLGSSHGVDLDRFSRGANIPDVDERTRIFLDETEGLTVGFVGRLHPDKGIDTLLEALTIVAESGTKVRAVLVGGDEGADVSARVSALSDKVAVHLTGAVPDPRPYLIEFDVIVLVSLREGFPNVILEAAAMKVPAIVSRSTGTVDSVEDGITGLIVGVSDSTALALGISQIAASPDKRRDFGESARNWVASAFGQEEVWKLHIEYFAAALEQRKPRSRR